MPVHHCGRDVPLSKSFVVLTSQFLGAIGDHATTICCVGAILDFIKALHKIPGSKGDVEYPFSLTPLRFDQLLQKLSFSVMGKIDMFFMLRTFFAPHGVTGRTLGSADQVFWEG